MEEENEQLDYDEEGLKSALKKAQQLQQAVAKEQQPEKPTEADVPSPPGVDKEEKIVEFTQKIPVVSATASTSANLSKFYVNPNFRRRQPPRGMPSGASGKAFALVSPNVHPGCSTISPQVPPPVNTLHTLVQQPSHKQMSQFFAHSTHPQTWTPQIQQFPASSNFQTAEMPSNIYINPSIFNAADASRLALHSGSSVNWDSMVDEFVKKNVSVRHRMYQKSRTRTPSSASSFSSSSRSRSRNRSKSGNSSSPTNVRWKEKRRRRSYSPKRKMKSTSEKSKISNQMVECAKAIGLDEEYLNKIKEQERMRDEIARKKTQHRKEVYARGEQETNAKEPTTRRKERPTLRMPPKTEFGKNTQTTSKGTTSKLRPYLAVTVTNLRGLVKSEESVALIASKIGPVKKVWQEGTADVCVIFEKHEDAKRFMQQYIGNVTTFGRVIDVTMKKVFLNTATG